MLGLRTLGWTSRRLTQIFLRSDQIFGGVNVILIGDFFQLLPVAKSLSTPIIDGIFLMMSLWTFLHTEHLLDQFFSLL
jgi:hypothetical protein